MFIGLGVNILGGQKFRSQADRLREIGGLIYCKDYQNAGDVLADYAAGSPIGVFTSARSATAPATYVDDKGVIQLVTTADKPRFKGGYYDATGFHSQRGLMVEPASTNLLTYTDGTAYSGGVWTGWTAGGSQVTGTVTKTVEPIPELISISGATSQRVQYTGVAGDGAGKTLQTVSASVGGFTAGDKVTVSVKVKSRNGIGNVAGGFRLIVSSTPSYAYTLTNISKTEVIGKFVEYSVTHTVASGDTNVYFDVAANLIQDGQYVDFEIACPQLEKRHDATSYIPTSGSALTRPAEVLKYATAGNRNASEETVLIKFAPNSTFANDGIVRVLSSSDTKGRNFYKNTTRTDITAYPNNQDSPTVLRETNVTQLANVSSVYAAVLKHSSPYISVFSDGVVKGTYTSGDWVNPAWGTYFYLGSGTAGTNQLSGIIQSVAIFGRGLSDAEEATATAIMNN